MTTMTTSAPIIQNHTSNLSWLASAAMNQVKTTIPLVGVSALIGYTLNRLGLKIHANMTPKDAAVYFALLPLISKLVDPIFKRLISDRDCKDQKQLAARRTIQNYIKLSCSPFLATLGYSLIAKYLNCNPLEFTEVMSKQIFMLQTQATIMGACQMINNAIKTFNDAYDLDIPQDEFGAITPASSETTTSQPPSSSADKGMSKLEPVIA
jgi:hypothetical protein